MLPWHIDICYKDCIKLLVFEAVDACTTAVSLGQRSLTGKDIYLICHQHDAFMRFLGKNSSCNLVYVNSFHNLSLYPRALAMSWVISLSTAYGLLIILQP